ncbi:3d709eae-5e4a-48fd-81f9-c583f3fe8c4d [Thermothielavioides terrestris]|uniref:3d709eae-5e4a-48fd-81f9-c583f3fe8c4d n=1 Tax=Thermothielavioides terrestris TaxID=2587410 RepID=A0A3S5CXJ9_9PEZI|nr:3d709eae-5e4a-48fd-81f9-c583f3fe8c4d [Thermothielavioides terrestris]
MASSHLLYRL